jgi:thiamine-phosphate diphosphorylase
MDGVHVGQDDTSVEDIKSRFPSLLVGVSTHKLAEMEAALNGPSDYVAWGPIYQTASKKNPEPTVGAESLPLVGKASRDRGRPLVGIGGIDEARIGLVGPHLDYVAMISALVGGASAQRNPYEWIYERAMQLNARVSAISRS